MGRKWFETEFGLTSGTDTETRYRTEKVYIGGRVESVILNGGLKRND